ncbi:MAG: single-stranded DNA-binding protein [Flavobacteriaceae bacterium]|nr:single-stranded DNA-binding protein [Flavobacteriaceae bacterium]
MSTLKNHVQLIGNVGQEPTITNLESGKKVARFSIATNDHYKNNKGEKVQSTDWHTVVAWGKTAEIIENYVGKGKEMGVLAQLCLPFLPGVPPEGKILAGRFIGC